LLSAGREAKSVLFAVHEHATDAVSAGLLERMTRDRLRIDAAGEKHEPARQARGQPFPFFRRRDVARYLEEHTFAKDEVPA
jgi:hypothetical protein